MTELRTTMNGYLRWLMRALWVPCLTLVGVAAQAQDIERGRSYFNDGNWCTRCHGVTATGEPPPDTAYRAIPLDQTWLSNEPADLRARINGLRGNATEMAVLADSTGTQVADVHAYLVAIRSATVAATSPTAVTGAAVFKSSLNNTITFSVSNYRFEALNYSLAVVDREDRDASEFPITSTTSGSCPAASTNGVPTVCSRSVALSFSPQVAGTREARVRIRPVYSVSEPTSNASLLDHFIPVSGVASAAISADRTGLQFTTSSASPTETKRVKMTDNAGDRIRLCRRSAASFDGKLRYTLAGYALSADCVILPAVAATPAAPRVVDLDVMFDPQGETAPLNAELEVQQVDVSGNPTAVMALVIRLEGNGAIAFVSSNELFGNSNIDVDGASALAAVDVSSLGSRALTFSATSAFSIANGQRADDQLVNGQLVEGGCTAAPATGNSGDYALQPGGCAPGSSLDPFTGAPAPSCSVGMRFDPVAAGRRCAILTINTNAGARTVVLQGSGFVGPRLTISEGSVGLASGDLLNFTAQRLQPEVPYPARSLSLRNAGTSGNLELVLPAAGAVPGFTVRAGAGCSAALAPYIASVGPECVVNVAFAPAELRHYEGAFDVLTRPAGSIGAYTVFRVNVAGVGSDVAPMLRWRDAAGREVSSFGFGRLVAGVDALPASTTVYLHNQGPGSVKLDLVNAVGADATSYRARLVGCSAGSFIAEGGTPCAVAVDFQPGTAGVKQATLQAISSGNGPPELALSGALDADSSPPVLNVSMSTTFDTTHVGGRSNSVEASLTNSGDFALQVAGLSVNGPFAIVGSTCPATPFVLQPRSRCTVILSFQPTASGAAAGSFEVSTNLSATPEVASLSAEGEAAADLSSGGCSMTDGRAPTDPTLWTLLLLAAIALYARRRRRTGRRVGPHGCARR